MTYFYVLFRCVHGSEVGWRCGVCLREHRHPASSGGTGQPSPGQEEESHRGEEDNTAHSPLPAPPSAVLLSPFPPSCVSVRPGAAAAAGVEASRASRRRWADVRRVEFHAPIKGILK